MTLNVDIRLHGKTSLTNGRAAPGYTMAFAFPSRWMTAWPDSDDSKNRTSNICPH